MLSLRTTLQIFVKDESDSPNKYLDADIVCMVAFFIDKVYVKYRGLVSLLLVLIVQHWWQVCSCFHMRLVCTKEQIQGTKTYFNLTVRYNPKFNDYIELKSKHTEDAPNWANYNYICRDFDMLCSGLFEI